MTIFKQKGSESLFTLLSVSAAVSFLFGFFVPLSTIVSNSHVFYISGIGQIIANGLVCFLVLMVVVSGIFLLLQKFFPKYNLFVLMITASLAAAFYAQGNLIGAEYPVLDGRPIDWDSMTMVGIFNTLFWCVLPAGAIFCAVKWREKCLPYLKNAMLIFTGFMLLVLSLRLATFSTNAPATAEFTDKDYFAVSSTRNVLIFVVDSMEQDLFEKSLEEYPEIKDQLKDFTYYSNTIGKFPTTKGALPQIVTGIANDNSKTYSEYLNHSFVNSGFLTGTRNLDYDVNLYMSYEFAPHIDVLKKVGNITNGRGISNDNFRFYRSAYKHSLFIYVPHYLKRLFVYKKDDTSFDTLLQSNGELLTIFSPRKVVKVYHMTGVHPPNNTTECVKKNINYISAYINGLKRLGVYEKSAIIIAADHGVVTPERPAFMVKNANGKFTVDERAFSYDDLGTVMTSMLEDKEVVVPESKGRRVFFKYSWDDVWSAQHLPEITKIAYDAAGQVCFDKKFCKEKYTTEDFGVLASNMFPDNWFGKSGSLNVPLMDKFKNKKISIKLQTAVLLSPESPEQEVEFFANDKKIKTVKYKYPDRRQTVLLDIPAEVNNLNSVTLVFTTRHMRSPADLKQSADGRALGVHIRECRIMLTQWNGKITYLPKLLNEFESTNMSSEENGRWSAQTGKIKLPLHKELCGKKIYIQLNTGVLLSQRHKEQEIEFIANGKTVLKEKYTFPENAKAVVLEIDPELNDQEHIQLEFRAKYAVSPKAISDSPDVRILGVCINQCQIQLEKPEIQ